MKNTPQEIPNEVNVDIVATKKGENVGEVSFYGRKQEETVIYFREQLVKLRQQIKECNAKIAENANWMLENEIPTARLSTPKEHIQTLIQRKNELRELEATLLQQVEEDEKHR